MSSRQGGIVAGIIELSVKNRFFVLLLALLTTVGGIWVVSETPVDAIPDLSDVQVIVYTEVPGQAPQVVEDQVTYPLSTSLLAVPYAQDVRGYSFFGFSMVYVIFEDGTDLYWARSRVLESLNAARGRLPAGITPQLGPDATGVGWVYEYTLTDFSPRARVLREHWDANGDGHVAEAELPQDLDLTGLLGEDGARYAREAFDRDSEVGLSRAEVLRAANFRGVDLAELRSIQDWYLRYDLMSQDGVAEVASVGGFVKQYQVEVDPEKLRAYGIPLKHVRMAIQGANQDVGGRLIEMAETEFMVRGQGYIDSVEDLETIPVGMDAEAHAPVLLKQVARVQIGPDVRRGLVEMNGEGEVVTGIVLLRYGENALETIRAVEERIEELKPGLPEGVEVHVSYDRSDLITDAIDSLVVKLGEEMLVVALVCIVFLLHFRSSLVAILALPVGVLMAFIAMGALGINANIMSLGGIAIAIGVMVDASVVMVENLHKHKERGAFNTQEELVIASAKEVGPALFFSLLVVTVSFLPVFTLEQQEGRLFTPLALTKTFAMAASAVLAITVIPALMYYLVRGTVRTEKENPLSRFFIAIYRPVIRTVLNAPRRVLFAAVLLVGATAWPASQIGSEFMPPLNEGDLLYMPTTPPGLSVTKARELLQQTDKLIAQHPQVEHVLGKIGRADTATDPAPLTMIETTILLTPQDTWPDGKTIENIAAELDQMVQFPGVTNAWTMPIKTRIDMLATGIKTPVGVKLLGDDLDELSRVGQQIEAVLQTQPGTASVFSERVVGGNFIDIQVRRQDAARYGLNVEDVNDVIKSAIGGMNVTWTVEGLERYPVNVRFPRELRNDIDSLESVPIQTPMGHTVPLAQVADIAITKGAPAIKSENARRTAWIYVDLTTDDIGGYVEEARELVRREVPMPPGVSIEWSGQYEYMERANARLRLVLPLTLALIFVFLYAHFRRFGETGMVMIGTIVFAPIGGIWLLYWMDFNSSVAVQVGMIALLGLAAETGVVMLVYLDEAVERYRAEGRMKTDLDLVAAITEGAVDRVRPKLMSVATTLIGLLPIMFGTETGTRVMKRIAAPMVGGLVSSTVLTLLVLPAIYLLWKRLWVFEDAHSPDSVPPVRRVPPEEP